VRRLPSALAVVVWFWQVGGGWLYQDVDALKPSEIEFKCVSETVATEAQLNDLKFAWSCVKHVKSNAITVCKDMRMLGMGSGQPNRVKSVEISLEKAGEDVKGSVRHCHLDRVCSEANVRICTVSSHTVH